MRTVPNDVFKSIYQSKLSKYSMIIMLLLCRCCDADGKLTATAADLAAEIGANASTVYRCIRQLKDNWLIHTIKHGGEIVITINGCEYIRNNRNYNTVRLDYVNYTAERLKKLSASAIRQLLYLFFRATNGANHENGNRLIYSHTARKISYDTIRNAINPELSIRTVLRGLKQLREQKIISVGINVGLEHGSNYDIITVNKSAMKTQRFRAVEKGSVKNVEHTTFFECNKWEIGNICRRVGVKSISDFAKNGAAVLMEQFAVKAANVKMQIDHVMQAAFSIVLDSRTSRQIVREDLKTLNVIINRLISDSRLARRFVFVH
ncbi:MAG TPA: hypothetical protein DEP65_13690 [Ruminococcus sp.]|nr:hypothetical protein [Ruminococcus sp.]